MKHLYMLNHLLQRIKDEPQRLLLPCLKQFPVRLFSALLPFLLFILGMNLNAQTYCSPSFSFGAAALSNDFWITSVSFGTLNYTGGTALSSSPYYALLSNTGAVTQGQTYTLNLTRNGNSYNCWVNIYADWNDDGDFDDSGETLAANYLLPASGTNTCTISGIVVPYLAVSNIRLRAMIKYSTAVTNSCTPGGSAQGEAKDFEITVNSGVACTGSPAKAIASSALVCAGVSTTLSLTGLTPASGYTYLWKQSATNGGPYSPAAGANTNATLTTPGTLPFPTTYYICEVTCSNSGLTTSSTEGSVAPENFLNCYCTTDFSSAAATTARGLRNVTLAGNSVTINNSTAANTANPSPYSLYVSPVANLTAGQPYTLSTNVGTATNNLHYIAAWIDYDQDGMFGGYTSGGAFNGTGDFNAGGVNERIATVGPTTNVTSNTPFTVAASAKSGTTAMRVRYRYGATMSGIGACQKLTGTATSGGAGEVEDYRISIVSACSAPSTGASAGNVTPSTASASLNWTSGNGTGGRLVILREGSAVNSAPVSGTSYTANATFKSGTQLGTGNYVVYNGTGASVNITNLLPATNYYYAIYEYNTTGTCYVNTGYTGSFTTASCSPTVQASAVNVSCYDYDKMTLDFNRGNGTNVLVLAKAGSAVDGTPAYNTSYTANANFGGGDQIGSGNYVVYNGNNIGTISLPITGLNTGTTYHFKIFEYNASPNCYSIAPVSANQTTRNPGLYTSSTTTQNTNNILPWSVDQDIIRLDVVLSGGSDEAVIMNSITFNTTGSTKTSNISAAKIFYTGTSNTFSPKTQFGATINSPSGSHTVNDQMYLTGAGTHYFWLAYDIVETPVMADVVDAQITSFNLTDHAGVFNKTPTVTAPAGNRKISLPSPPAPCTPSHNNSVGDCISSVQFAGYTYGASTNNCGNYNNYLSAGGPTVIPGSTYTLSYYADDLIGNTNSVWIDWDQSGTFAASGVEMVRLDGGSFSVSISVTVPLTATPGPTRLRIANRFPSAGSNACTGSNGSSTSGLTSDFLITVAGAGGGPTPPVICNTPRPVLSSPVVYTESDLASPLSATGSSLLWYTAPAGGTGSATAPTPSTSSPGTTAWYVSQNTGCESVRKQIAVYVKPKKACKTVWNGSVSTAWDNAANWTPANVPTATSSVEIPLKTNQPVIPVTVNGAVGNITFTDPNVTLTITAGQVLSVKGNWTGNNTLLAGAGKVIFDHTSAQTISGATSWQNLHINNTAGLTVSAGSQTVNRALELNKGTFTTNNNLTIRANSTISGYIDNFSTGFSGQLGNSEQVQFIRSFSGGTGYHYLSCPVDPTGLNVSNFGAFVSGRDNDRYNPTSANPVNFPTCWVYDETYNFVDNYQKGWISQTGTQAIVSAKGYALVVPTAQSVSLTGLPVNTAKSITVTNDYSGFNLIGNPFLTTVDWKRLRDDNTSFIANSVQFFQTSGQYAGQYRSYTWNGVTGFGSDLGGGEYVTNAIAPAQAMFVQASGSGGSFTFNLNSRMASSDLRFFEESEAPRLLRLKIFGGTGADESLLSFGSGNDAFDLQEDAVKMFGTNQGLPNIYTLSESKALMVNQMSETLSDKKIAVGVKITQSGTYRFQFDGLESFESTELFYFKDAETGNITNLRQNNKIQISLPAGVYNNRFFLYATPEVLTSVIDETCHQNDGKISVTNYSDFTWGAILKNAQGQVAAVAESIRGVYDFANLSGGDYQLSLRTMDGYADERSVRLEEGMSLNAAFNVPAETFYVNTPLQLTTNYTEQNLSYRWDFGDGNTLSGISSPVHSYSHPGIYTVQLIISDGECTGITNQVITVLDDDIALGIDETRAADFFTIYPNPARDLITMQFKPAMKEQPEWVEIQDAAGRLISRELVKGMVQEGNITFPINHLQAGSYRLVLITTQSRFAKGFHIVK